MVLFFEEILKSLIQFFQHLYHHIRCHSKCCEENECDCDCDNDSDKQE